MWSYTSYDRGMQSQCKYLNISVCDISGSWETSIPDNEFDVFVYNPLGRGITSTLTRFPVPGPDWNILDTQVDNKKRDDGMVTAAAPIQTLQIAEAVKKIPGREQWRHIDHEIIFPTGNIPPLSQRRYTFRKTKASKQSPMYKFAHFLKLFSAQHFHLELEGCIKFVKIFEQ